jgi:deoxycytidylate deaminase
MAEAVPKINPGLPIIGGDTSSQAILQKSMSSELVFAVVGHVGSGTSTIAMQLKALLEEQQLDGGPFQTAILKAREGIIAWAKSNQKDLPSEDRDDLSVVERFQDLGDEMRLNMKDHSAVARAIVASIRHRRASWLGTSAESGKAVEPDSRRRAYIIDALRHPAEAHLLRSIYDNAFTLVGVVAEERVRLQRLTKKYKNAGEKNANAFMARDAQGGIEHGQRVGDTFHLSDYFVDNSETREESSSQDWTVPEALSRLVKIVIHSQIVRPTASESAMFHAFGAMRASACLSRQVGAAIVDEHDNLVATGTNEVPKAGGGIYRDEGLHGDHDGRCAYRDVPNCSNTIEQNKLIREAEEAIRSEVKTALERGGLAMATSAALLKEIAFSRVLRSTGIGRLLEFSRAVHAEMDAILTAGRTGVNIRGGRLFVTTFPCHYCARHIVAAGIDEVQYIEPYPKSLALKLHEDSITPLVKDWQRPSTQSGAKVMFRPFTGVGPNLFARAFLKDRELKDKESGELKIIAPEWGAAFHQLRLGYADLEAKLEVPNG